MEKQEEREMRERENRKNSLTFSISNCISSRRRLESDENVYTVKFVCKFASPKDMEESERERERCAKFFYALQNFRGVLT